LPSKASKSLIAKTSDMPSFAGRLSNDEIADLVAYLISLKG